MAIFEHEAKSNKWQNIQVAFTVAINCSTITRHNCL